MNNKVHIPSRLSIDEGDLPALKDWKVGDTYSMYITARLISQKKGDAMLKEMGDKDAQDIHSEFEVLHVDEENEKKEKKKYIKKAIESYKE